MANDRVWRRGTEVGVALPLLPGARRLGGPLRGRLGTRSCTLGWLPFRFFGGGGGPGGDVGDGVGGGVGGKICLINMLALEPLLLYIVT